jgi:hypothetical protein
MIGLVALCSSAQALAVTNDVSWVQDPYLRGISCDEGCDPSCGCDCGDPCDCGAGVCGKGGLLGAIEGFTLEGMLGCDPDSPWELGGWTNLAYYDNNIPLSQAYDDLLSFNDLPDQLNLAQQWLYFGRTTDGSNGLDIGGRIDVLYGTDAQKSQAFGNPRLAFATPASGMLRSTTASTVGRFRKPIWKLPRVTSRPRLVTSSPRSVGK